MSQSITLGQSICQAVRFLEGIHRDAFTLLTTLDELMQKEGWYSTEKGKVSDDLSNALTADKWVIKSLYRIFAPQRRVTNTDRAVAIHVEFDPPNAYDEPLCLLIAARFPTPTSYDDIWNHWDRSGSERVLRYLAVNKGVQALDQQLLHQDFLPQANKAAAFCVPLCDLDGINAVKDKIVTPLLQTVNAL